MPNEDARNQRSAAWGVAAGVFCAFAIATWQVAIAPKSTFPIWPTYLVGALGAIALYLCFATIWGWWPARRYARGTADVRAEPPAADVPGAIHAERRASFVATGDSATAATGPTQRPVRVFISYSHDTQEHATRVRDLTQRLRREGVDAIIDQFFPFPTEGWIRWMVQQVKSADFILCVCTDDYRIGFDGASQEESGKGVSWEAKIISECIYDARGENSRFIPVCFAEDASSAIPLALKSYTYFALDRQYDELYFLLTAQPAVRPEKLRTVRARPGPLDPVEVISPGIPSTALSLDRATLIEQKIRVITAGPGKDAEAALRQLEQMARSTDGDVLAETIIRQLISYISALESSATYPTDERLLRKEVVRTLIRLADGKLSTYLPDRALSGIDLAMFDFRGADLVGVNFAGSFMIECDFRGVDLRRSSFEGCSIRNARFDGAALDGVDFSDADWFNALGLSTTQLSASQSSTLMRSPVTEAEMLAFLDERYSFPFSSWEWRVKRDLRQTWDAYLQPGGVASEVARWSGPAELQA